MTETNNQKRILKNTIMLYVRMLLIIVVSLYTSRVVLTVLGIDDFGIYNIVGSVVVSLTFVQNSLSSATQRYLSYEIGRRNDNKLSEVFSTSLNIQFIFVLVILILLETIGLFFLNRVLQIPPGRIIAANIAYQFSVATFVVNIIRVPYNALIIAEEKMDIYAVISIFEAFLKLGIVYVLLIINNDKLIEYSVLVFIITILINLVYISYCRIKYKSICKYSFKRDKQLFKDMLSFSGWNLVGGMTGVATNEGPNYILNYFFGVGLNAAMGIAKQVASAIYTFTENFQTAFRPQIVKYYAVDDKSNLFELVCNASKISYYLLFIIGLPIIISINEILDVWLDVVPEYSASFCVCILIGYFINALSSPLWMLAHATGEIKNYQIVISIISLLIIPISILLLCLKFEPYFILLAQAILNCLICAYRLYFVNKKTGLSIKTFLYKVILPVSVVTIVCAVLSFCVKNICGNWILISAISLIVCIPIIFFIGFTKPQRKQLYKFIIYN